MNTINQAVVNKSATNKIDYKQIEITVSGGKVTVLFPMQSSTTDIMTVVRDVLVSSYVDSGMNTKNKKC